ncbi:MAG: hypothetical protein VW362_07040 [Candidatus Nanopelagicales bacterium]
MSRTTRKFVRDGAVAVVGTVLFYVGNNAADVLPPETAGLVGPVSLLLYRFIRERSVTVAGIDPK